MGAPRQPPVEPAYLSLGANLGRREQSVLRAVHLLQRLEKCQVHAISSLYESAPVGVGDQPPYINAVTEVLTLLSPGDLLKRLKTIEGLLGRSGGHNAPREIDIDIIALGGVVVDEPELTVPHARYTERAFVLIPLQEVAPTYTCPRTGLSIDRMIATLPAGQRVRRVSGRGIVTAITS